MELPSDPNAVVLEFDRVPGQIAEPDPEPLVRVYADGRVQVHRPWYSKRAGDYETRLRPEELEDLLGLLADKGVMDVDPGTVRERVRAAQEQRRQRAQVEAGAVLSAVADDAVTRVRVRLQAYRSSATQRAIANFDRTLTWKGLQGEAALYPEVATLQDLAAAARALRALAEREDLAPAPSAEGREP